MANTEINTFSAQSLQPFDIPNAPDLLAGIGNHEAKSLLMLYLAKSPYFQPTHELGNGLKDFIGTGAAWYPSNTVPFQYCANSLEPIGQVARGRVESSRGGYSTAFAISEAGNNIGVPTAGLLLQWGLTFPEISVQQIFGPTHSKGKVRAPQNRIEFLGQLITNPSLNPSVSEIADLNPKDWRSQQYTDSLRQTDSAARALAQLGIVNIEREAETNNRLFRIHGIDPPNQTGRKRGIVHEAVQGFIVYRFENGEVEFTFEECVKAVVNSINQSENSIDPAEIRERVNHVLVSKRIDPSSNKSKYRSHPSTERVERPNEQDHTRVTAVNNHREAIEHLLNIVMAIDEGDEATIARGRQYAESISGDDISKKVLIEKAYSFSAAARKKPIEETTRAVLALLENYHQPVDAETIYEAYKEHDSRPISRSTINFILRNLSDKKIVTVNKQRTKISTRKQRNYYTITSDSAEPSI